MAHGDDLEQALIAQIEKRKNCRLFRNCCPPLPMHWAGHKNGVKVHVVLSTYSTP